MTGKQILIPACEFDREPAVLMGLSVSELIIAISISLLLGSPVTVGFLFWLGFMAALAALFVQSILITFVIAKIMSTTKKGKPHAYYSQKIMKRFKPNYNGEWDTNRHVQ